MGMPTPQQLLMAGLGQGLPTPTVAGGKANSASKLLVQNTGWIIAASWGENTGSAAVRAYLHDGQDANGVVIAVLSTIAGGGGSLGPGGPGIPFRDGLYLEIASGALDLAVNYVPLINAPA